MDNNQLFKGVEGAIFDLDGTLVDSLSVWHDIDIDFFKKHGMDVPQDYFVNIGHMSFMEMAKYTQERFSFKESPKEIADYWVKQSEVAYATKVTAKPYAKEMLKYLKEVKHLPISLATSNRKELYEPCLKNLGMFQYFDYFMNVNDINSSKSEPKIYLNLASIMKSDPKDTLVFEDILTACKTAYQAGFRTVGVFDQSSKKNEELIKENSSRYILSFKELLN